METLPSALDPSRHPWMRESGLVSIWEAIESAGGEARVVGGAVRDSLLGREVHDIDLAVNLLPEQVSSILSAVGMKVVPTGIAHGTVTVVADHKGYEITTLRHDIQPDGRRTKVLFTDDWAADAARRDFTFNALYLDKNGKIWDYFDGITDLAQCCVRFIGDPCERIQEDVLRILRVFRFYAQICGTVCPAVIEPKSLAACYVLAHLLPSLSAERVGKEITRMLATENPLPSCALMAQGKVLDSLLPELKRLDRLEKLLKVERGRAEPCAVRRLAALMEGDAASVARRLRLSKMDARRLDILSLVYSPMWQHVREPFDVRQKLYDYGPETMRDALLLLASHQKIRIDALLGVVEAWIKPVFPLKGKDIQALGVVEGPQLGDILKQAEIWWRGNDFRPSKEECLASLRAGGHCSSGNAC